MPKSPQLLRPSAETKHSNQRPLRGHLPNHDLFCPFCNEVILKTVVAYTNHNVTIVNGYCRTALGTVPIGLGITCVLIAALETYPAAVAYETMCNFYAANLDIAYHKIADDPRNSMKVLISRHRARLVTIGISFSVSWGFGHRMVLSKELSS